MLIIPISIVNTESITSSAELWRRLGWGQLTTILNTDRSDALVNQKRAKWMNIFQGHMNMSLNGKKQKSGVYGNLLRRCIE